MQDNLHFFELEIYEIIREDYVRFLRKSTRRKSSATRYRLPVPLQQEITS